MGFSSVATSTQLALRDIFETPWSERSLWTKVVVVSGVILAGLVYYLWSARPRSFEINTSQLSEEGKAAVLKVQQLYAEAKNLQKTEYKSPVGPQNPVIPYIAKLFSTITAQDLKSSRIQENQLEREQIAFTYALLILEDLPKIRAAYQQFKDQQDHQVVKDHTCYASGSLVICCRIVAKNPDLFRDLEPRLKEIRYRELLNPRPPHIPLDSKTLSPVGQQALNSARALYEATPDIEMFTFDEFSFQPQISFIYYLTRFFRAQFDNMNESTKKQVMAVAYVYAHFILDDLPKVKAKYPALGATQEHTIWKVRGFYGTNDLVACCRLLVETPLMRDIAPRIAGFEMAEIVPENHRPIFEAWEYYYSFPLLEPITPVTRFRMGPIHPETIQAITRFKAENIEMVLLNQESILKNAKLTFVIACLALDEIPALKDKYPELKNKTPQEIVLNDNCYIGMRLKEAKQQLCLQFQTPYVKSKWSSSHAAVQYANKLDHILFQRCKKLGIELFYSTVALDQSYRPNQ